jgi:hypothetical protein
MSAHSNSKDSKDSKESIDSYEVSPIYLSPERPAPIISSRRLPTPRYLSEDLRIYSRCNPDDLLFGPIESDIYPIGMLNIFMHGQIEVKLRNINVEFNKLAITDYLPDTTVYYRSNTLAGCYNYGHSTKYGQDLTNTFNKYVSMFNRNPNTFEEKFDEIDKEKSEKKDYKLKNNYKREILSLKHTIPYTSKVREEQRILTNMYKKIKEQNAQHSYIPCTRILNKYYTATSSIKKLYDLDDPESCLLFSYAYLFEGNIWETLYFDLLQWDYNPRTPKYKDYCIYGLWNLLHLLFSSEVDNYQDPSSPFHIIKPFVDFVEKLTKVQANPEYITTDDEDPENTRKIAEKRKYYDFNTFDLLNFLSILKLKKLYIYDNSCSDYGMDSLFMTQHIDDAISTLPPNIAKGNKKTKKRKRRKNKRIKSRKQK